MTYQNEGELEIAEASQIVYCDLQPLQVELMDEYRIFIILRKRG